MLQQRVWLQGSIVQVRQIWRLRLRLMGAAVEYQRMQHPQQKERSCKGGERPAVVKDSLRNCRCRPLYPVHIQATGVAAAGMWFRLLWRLQRCCSSSGCNRKSTIWNAMGQRSGASGRNSNAAAARRQWRRWVLVAVLLVRRGEVTVEGHLPAARVRSRVAPVINRTTVAVLCPV